MNLWVRVGNDIRLIRDVYNFNISERNSDGNYHCTCTAPGKLVDKMRTTLHYGKLETCKAVLAEAQRIIATGEVLDMNKFEEEGA